MYVIFDSILELLNIIPYPYRFGSFVGSMILLGYFVFGLPVFYYFDKNQLKWVLEKIKLACDNCGVQRWLNAEDYWKKLCLKCNRKTNT